MQDNFLMDEKKTRQQNVDLQKDAENIIDGIM